MKCPACEEGRHESCHGSIPTGRQVPETDPYRTATRMVAEYQPCGCDCQNSVVPW